MVGATQEEENGSISEYKGEDEALSSGVVNHESFAAEPQTMLFNEEYQGHQSFPDVYAPAYHIGFQASGGEDSLVQENTTELSGTFHDLQGQRLDFDQFSTNLNHYSGGYANLNGGGYQGGSVSDGGPDGLLYIQTSWPSNYGVTGAMSSDTSVDQTPAGPSAGTDFGTGYFSNPEFDFESFDDGGAFPFD